MTKRPRFSMRFAVLLVFLRNGNQPLNASRIPKFIAKLDLGSFGKNDCRTVSVSKSSIDAICSDLARDGLLEAIMARPPRSSEKKKTPHYRLPLSDEKEPLKAIRVARFLLRRAGAELIDSDYGKYVATDLMPTWVEGLLDIRLTGHERADLIDKCSTSPSALGRALNPRLPQAIEAITARRATKDPLPRVLLEYLEAARLLDIVDSQQVLTPD